MHKGKRVKKLKLKAKIVELFEYQADFAHAVEVDTSYISHIVSGTKELPQKHRRKWADALDSTVAELFPQE